MLAFPPLHLFMRYGAGGAAGQVLHCPASLLTCGWGKGTALTNDNSIPILHPKWMFPRFSILFFSFSQHLQLIVLITSICVQPHHQHMCPIPSPPGSSWQLVYKNTSYWCPLTYIQSPILWAKVIPTSNRSVSPILQSYFIPIFSKVFTFFLLCGNGKGFFLHFVQINYTYIYLTFPCFGRGEIVFPLFNIKTTTYTYTPTNLIL